MKIKDMTHTSLCKALLPTITECYFANRQKLEKGESMEMITAQVANEAMKIRPTATPQELGEAFRNGAGGDYETNGQPPYLTPNKFRYFIKAYYDSKQMINAQHEEEPRAALPYFASEDERHIYHLTRRYADTLKGLIVMMGDADILFAFLKRIGMATDRDYSGDDILARARHDISVQPSADTLLLGIAKSALMRMEDYDEVAKVAKGIFIRDLYQMWRDVGMSVDDVQNMLREKSKKSVISVF